MVGEAPTIDLFELIRTQICDSEDFNLGGSVVYPLPYSSLILLYGVFDKVTFVEVPH
jgi:hypothetical protein